ncbi:excisionase family DNA-binding protein [Kineosporia sp. A_224]|uniref:excisionase family DNA-binding protein n=1 Tax=Kineosporia sp. A_224 TaxID=1962180 RepID=UPI000B4B3D5A|nr:excisionase family DNA-binding protein [Kineosporia sp. A_224]MBI4936319.1 excisionase family DNA-binding protein [Actinomycetota bacterium]
MPQNALRAPLPRKEHPSDHPLLTVRTAAEMLGCSDMTIRRRVYARQFPAVRIGRKTLVPREFVEGLLAAADAGETVVLEEFAAAWTTQNQAADR